MSIQKQQRFSDRLNHRYELTVVFFISLAVFLFILFFQPFDTKLFSLNDAILFLAGFGGINFLFMAVFLLIPPFYSPSRNQYRLAHYNPANWTLALMWIFDSTAFGFYIHFVGRVPLSMFIMFRVILICLASVIILKVVFMNRSLISEIDYLNEKIREKEENLKKITDEQKDETIEIFSDNRSEKVSAKVKDLILLQSADNYIEVLFRKDGTYVKKLIRNTLKNTEYILSKYQGFIRCHRSYIINLDYIEKLQRKSNGYQIELKGLNKQLPVSRQYLMRLRDALESKWS